MFPWLLTKISLIWSTKISINKLNAYKKYNWIKNKLNLNSNI